MSWQLAQTVSVWELFNRDQYFFRCEWWKQLSVAHNNGILKSIKIGNFDSPREQRKLKSLTAIKQWCFISLQKRYRILIVLTGVYNYNHCFWCQSNAVLRHLILVTPTKCRTFVVYCIIKYVLKMSLFYFLSLSIIACCRWYLRKPTCCVCPMENKKLTHENNELKNSLKRL